MNDHKKDARREEVSETKEKKGNERLDKGQQEDKNIAKGRQESSRKRSRRRPGVSQLPLQ